MRFEGQDLQTLDTGNMRGYRRSVQAVFRTVRVAESADAGRLDIVEPLDNES
jgi:hypothetical protein